MRLIRPRAGAWMDVVNDVLFLAIFLAVMALALGYIRVCERIVGRDDAESQR